MLRVVFVSESDRLGCTPREVYAIRVARVARMCCGIEVPVDLLSELDTLQVIKLKRFNALVRAMSTPVFPLHAKLLVALSPFDDVQTPSLGVNALVYLSAYRTPALSANHDRLTAFVTTCERVLLVWNLGRVQTQPLTYPHSGFSTTLRVPHSSNLPRVSVAFAKQSSPH